MPNDPGLLAERFEWVDAKGLGGEERLSFIRIGCRRLMR
jgi:hypothetical protein